MYFICPVCGEHFLEPIVCPSCLEATRAVQISMTDSDTVEGKLREIERLMRTNRGVEQ